MIEAENQIRRRGCRQNADDLQKLWRPARTGTHLTAHRPALQGLRARFGLEDFPGSIDDALEALLAAVPCDRV